MDDEVVMCKESNVIQFVGSDTPTTYICNRSLGHDGPHYWVTVEEAEEGVNDGYES